MFDRVANNITIDDLLIILEIGAGTGKNAPHLLRDGHYGTDLVHLDLSAKRCRRAWVRAVKGNYHTRILRMLRMNITDLDFSQLGEIFCDYVFATGGLQFISQAQIVIFLTKLWKANHPIRRLVLRERIHLSDDMAEEFSATGFFYLRSLEWYMSGMNSLCPEFIVEVGTSVT